MWGTQEPFAQQNLQDPGAWEPQHQFDPTKLHEIRFLGIFIDEELDFSQDL